MTISRESNRRGTSQAITSAVNGFGVLRSVLEKACAKNGACLGDLTVLSAQVDPYRLDTPAGHRDGQWLANHFNRLVGANRRIHWRGVHYVLVSTTAIVKPNGEPYVNDDANWTWLIDTAGKAARWLGYIPFDRIVDIGRHALGLERSSRLAWTLRFQMPRIWSPLRSPKDLNQGKPMRLSSSARKLARGRASSDCSRQTG